MSVIELEENIAALKKVQVTAQQTGISNRMDRKVYSVEDNITQAGGSVLQSLQNLPGITVQDSKVQLRGNDKVTILIDGKQTQGCSHDLIDPVLNCIAATKFPQQPLSERSGPCALQTSIILPNQATCGMPVH